MTGEDSLVKRIISEGGDELIIPEWVTEAVKAKQVEIRITIEPDRQEIEIEPWQPYEMKCPYGRGE